MVANSHGPMILPHMIEYVFRPSRRQGRKRVKSRLYRGRYSLARGQKPATVALHTPDKAVAQKRLRDLVVQKQMEAEGMSASQAQIEAATTPLVVLLADYKADLVGRDLEPGHISDTIGRLQRMAQATHWAKLSDIRPDNFVRWRAGLSLAAKTKKEYQTSINAFLNWCVRTDRLKTNPLAKVDRVEIRGKQKRPSRAFRPEELVKLFAAAPQRALFYRTLLYTGQRISEVAALVWLDLQLEDVGSGCYAKFRAGTTKDKKKRLVPLHAELVKELRALRPHGASPTDLVFSVVPCWETTRADLIRAGIELTDGLGRVVHRHAFRKTFQTMGVQSGINQRAAQELLGHSDPKLTAEVYTDVAALHLHKEIAKLPWITGAHIDAQFVRAVVPIRKISEIVEELVSAAKSLFPKQEESELPLFALAARHGFEP